MRVHIDIDLKRVHNISTDEKRPALAESEQNVLNALLLYGKADCLIKLINLSDGIRYNGRWNSWSSLADERQQHYTCIYILVKISNAPLLILN